MWTGSPKRVLILDDEPLLVRAVSRNLRAAGLVVDGTSDPAEALAMIARATPDVVVSDLHMPGSCGARFLGTVSTLATKALRVLLSADIDFRPVGGTPLLEAQAHVLLGKTELKQLSGIVIGHLRARTEMPVSDVDRFALASSVASVLGRPEYEDDGHRDRLSRWTTRVATLMNLPASQIAEARLGAILHDVGQMSVPPLYFSRAGSLRTDERTQVERHAGIGAELVSLMPGLCGAHAVVAAHHERHDGEGYPRRVGGDAIPAVARAFQVVDAYDAMTRDRPYRGAMTHEEAMATLLEGAGRHHHDDAVRALDSLGEEGLAAALVA